MNSAPFDGATPESLAALERITLTPKETREAVRYLGEGFLSLSVIKAFLKRVVVK